VTVGGEAAGRGDSGAGSAPVFLLVLPGVSVFALFMIADLAMRDTLTERRRGTLRRQLCGPVSTGAVVAGKALYTAVIATAGLAVLSAVGWVVRQRPVNLPGYAALAFAVVLMATGASALAYGLARTERQGSTISTAVFLCLAFVGGSFLPAASLPGPLRALAPYSPFHWAGRGFGALLQQGSGLREVLPDAALLSGVGALALVAGSRLLHGRVRRGSGA
jgi:ABC-2 type transport system permease protein